MYRARSCTELFWGVGGQGCKSVSSIGGMISIFWWPSWCWGGGGIISRFPVWDNFCYVQNSCFSTHLPLIFWWPFFCSPSFFPHFLLKCLNIYKYLSYLVSSTPSPPIIFRCRHGRKILGCTQQWAKIEIIGRDWGQILGGGGGCIPRDLQPCGWGRSL